MADTDDALITKVSPWSVPETLARLRAVIAARGMHVVAVIDVGAEPPDVVSDECETALVFVGDAAVTTPIVAAAPLSAFDLPPKVLVWADALETKVTYLSPAAFAARYDITVDVVAGLACVTEIVDVAIDR